MLEGIPPDQILFLDIETVSQEANAIELPEAILELWSHKARLVSHVPIDEWEVEQAVELYQGKAGIYAEFGKIIVISVAFIKYTDGKPILRLKSFADPEERIVLEDFSALLSAYFNNPERQYLCGHNIKEFDVPYLCRRMIVNGLKLPAMLDLTGKKPWETKYLLDTMELWKFGDYKHYTSLNLLAQIMGIPSPKDDIDGSDVSRVFWEEGDLDRIVTYCEKDVVTVAQLFLRMAGRLPLREDQIITVNN